MTNHNRRIYNIDKIVSIKIFEKVEIKDIEYHDGKIKGDNSKWFNKIKNFLIPRYKEGYYTVYGFQKDGPYTGEQIKREYNVIVEGDKIYKKPYLIISFVNGENVVRSFNSVEDKEYQYLINNLIPKNKYEFY